MSGTKAGAAKFTAKIKVSDPDYYKKLGSKGGSVKRPETRYFHTHPEVAKEAGALGGAVSRRTGIKQGEGKSKSTLRRKTVVGVDFGYSTKLEKIAPIPKPHFWQIKYKRQLKKLGVI